MAEYGYKAIDAKGAKVYGNLEATSLDDLEYRLDNQGFHLVSAKLRRESLALFRRRKITRRQLIVLFMYLEQMAEAGIPILDTLVEMRDSETSDAMRQVLSGLVDSITSGRTLSEAMEEYEKIFTKLMVSLVRAGEKSGNMGQIFGELKTMIAWQDEIINRTKKLMTYPLFVGVIVFGVVCFLMIYLVPQLISFISSMGEEIPLLTRILIVVSDFFVNYWFIIVLMPPGFFVSLKLILNRSTRSRFIFDRYKLNIPLFGEAIKKLILSRFCKSFALLYNAGISVLDCLDISADVVSNSYMEEEIDDIRGKISEGESIYDAFSSAGLFPPLVLRMIHVGEQTGGLGESLIKISDFYSRDVTDLVDKIQVMIEPAMTVIMGVILGWIMLAVLGPIYDIISTIQF